MSSVSRRSRHSRAVCALLAACAVAVLNPSAAGAQRGTQYDALRDYWAARSTVAAARLKALRYSVDSANSDTIRSRYFDMVSAPLLSGTAATAVELADSLANATWLPIRMGTRAQFELRSLPADVRVDVNGEAIGTTARAKLVMYLREADGAAKAMTSSDSSTVVMDAARMAVLSRMVEPALRQLDVTLRQWMAQTPAAEKPTTGDFRRAWLELATYPSLPARACLVGDLRACRTTLALVADSNPVLSWYDPAMRQTLAARWLRSYRFDRYNDPRGERRNATEHLRACADGRDDAGCIRFLKDRQLGASLVEPGPAWLRMLLVRFAFSFPADSAAREEAAYAPGLTIEQRLERASGLPFDALLRALHGRLAERRPVPNAPTPTLLWTTTMWCVAFGALSLRSSRWRG